MHHSFGSPVSHQGKVGPLGYAFRVVFVDLLASTSSALAVFETLLKIRRQLAAALVTDGTGGTYI